MPWKEHCQVSATPVAIHSHRDSCWRTECYVSKLSLIGILQPSDITKFERRITPEKDLRCVLYRPSPCIHKFLFGNALQFLSLMLEPNPIARLT